MRGFVDELSENMRFSLEWAIEKQSPWNDNRIKKIVIIYCGALLLLGIFIVLH